MPCNSDYMNPSSRERDMSRVYYFLAEIDGKRRDKNWLDGYHPDAYNNITPKAVRDAKVAELCSKLKAHPNVTQLSLELQMWWRDHQAADRRREKAEADAAEKAETKKAALAKLSKAEREALGLE